MKPNVAITRDAQGHEQRTFGTRLELRAAENEFVIHGTAAAYGVRSSLIGGQFYEQIARGAFSDSLRDDDICCSFNHDLNQLLGRKKAGTLTLRDTQNGLEFSCQLDRSNPVHQAVYALIKRGDVDGCSFAFTVPDGGDTWDTEDRILIRTLKRVKLFELGPVVQPAYPQGTSVGARAERRRSDYVPASEWRAAAQAKLAQLDDAYRRTLCAQLGHEIEGK
jgi:HK97 family phage prohead protease